MKTPALFDVLRYGGLGMPLAFVALPLVVQWPAFAASQWGLPLALLGGLLLAVRVADAFVDPWIGRRADVWFARSLHTPWNALALASSMLLLGFIALFFAPPVLHELASTGSAASGASGSAWALWVWCVLALALTYLGYSIAQVVHQAWAARLGGDEEQRSRWVGAREAFALVGVMAASVLPTAVGWAATGAVLALLMLLALGALRGLATGETAGPHGTAGLAPPDPIDRTSAQVSPWSVPAFRSLLMVYTVNGLAASIPASLVLFFVRDRIQAPPAFEALALASYFGAAALAVPLWVRAIRRVGLAHSWAAGMLLSILSFVGAISVGAGDTALFIAICVASGLALGADLVAPAALLAGIIERSGARGQAEGRWFGWWSMTTKLTLALAAGIALPLVQALGYSPGGRDPQALQALAVVYAVVPCMVKALALSAVLGWRHQWAPGVPPAARAGLRPDDQSEIPLEKALP